MVTQLVLPTFAISWVLLILSLVFSLSSCYNCPRVEVTGTLVWGPSWNYYKLCGPSDHGCKNCPQGYSRVYCHQQPQAGQDQPVVCAVCFNGHNFYGPECTTNGKLIKSTPKPEVEESTQEPEVPKIMADSEFVPEGRTSLIEEDQPPKGRKTDNTSLLWMGIGGLISCPFIVVIANGVYKRRHSMWTRIQEVRQMSNISNTSSATV